MVFCHKLYLLISKNGSTRNKTFFFFQPEPPFTIIVSNTVLCAVINPTLEMFEQIYKHFSLKRVLRSTSCRIACLFNHRHTLSQSCRKKNKQTRCTSTGFQNPTTKNHLFVTRPTRRHHRHRLRRRLHSRLKERTDLKMLDYV